VAPDWYSAAANSVCCKSCPLRRDGCRAWTGACAGGEVKPPFWLEPVSPAASLSVAEEGVKDGPAVEDSPDSCPCHRSSAMSGDQLWILLRWRLTFGPPVATLPSPTLMPAALDVDPGDTSSRSLESNVIQGFKYELMLGKVPGAARPSENLFVLSMFVTSFPARGQGMC
jgi:hypothetical protein